MIGLIDICAGSDQLRLLDRKLKLTRSYSSLKKLHEYDPLWPPGWMWIKVTLTCCQWFFGGLAFVACMVLLSPVFIYWFVRECMEREEQEKDWVRREALFDKLAAEDHNTPLENKDEGQDAPVQLDAIETVTERGQSDARRQSSSEGRITAGHDRENILERHS